MTTLEDMMPEIAGVFALQERSLHNAMTLVTTKVSLVEEESYKKASEMTQLAGKLRDAMQMVNEINKKYARMEKTTEKLTKDFEELKNLEAEKAKRSEVLMQGTNAANYAEDIQRKMESLEKKFEYLSRIKMEQKDLEKRFDRQEMTTGDLKLGLAMLTTSISGSEYDHSIENSSYVAQPTSV